MHVGWEFQIVSIESKYIKLQGSWNFVLGISMKKWSLGMMGMFEGRFGWPVMLQDGVEGTGLKDP